MRQEHEGLMRSPSAKSISSHDRAGGLDSVPKLAVYMIRLPSRPRAMLESGSRWLFRDENRVNNFLIERNSSFFFGDTAGKIVACFRETGSLAAPDGYKKMHPFSSKYILIIFNNSHLQSHLASCHTNPSFQPSTFQISQNEVHHLQHLRHNRTVNGCRQPDRGHQEGHSCCLQSL